MRHVDTIPDWAILVLAVLVVAGVYSLLGGFGVLALGIVATAVWIAQFIAGIRSVHDHGTVSRPAPAQHRHPCPKRRLLSARWGVD
jgi:hypothetical protein